MIGLLLALSCTAERAEAPPEAAGVGEESGPLDGDVLVVAGMFDPGSLNPLVLPYAFSAVFAGLTQPGLVERALGPQGLDFRPALAESWDWSEAGDALTYTLREGLTWDDGVALTAADVAFTYALIADPAVASNWYDDARQIAEITTRGDREITFRFHKPGNRVLLQATTARGVVPRHVLEDADRATLRGHTYSRAPSASGPWRVARWEPDAHLWLEPNPAATAFDRPHLSRVIVRIIPEYATRLIELQRGSVDMVVDVQKHDLPGLKAESPGLSLLRREAASMQYLGWNNADPRFTDPAVRRAMTLAIDRDKLIRDLLTVAGEPYGRPCVGTVGPDLGPWFNQEIAPLPHDPERARALLAAAGWADADGDGVLDRDGEPFAVTVIVQNGAPVLKEIAVSTQAQLKAVGVALELQLMEPNRFAQLAREHQFEAILWSFSNNPLVDPWIQWHSQGQYNWMGFQDPEVDRLLEAARAEPDPAAAQAMVREVQARVYEAQPATFLFWEDQITALDGRFRDTSSSPFSFLDRLERWWVPPGEQRYR